jgi:multicomponent Na+:H+ antiporter subunit D
MLLLKSLKAFGILSVGPVRFLEASAIAMWALSSVIILAAGAPSVLEGRPDISVMGGWPEPLGIELILDPVALVALALILIVGTTSLLYAYGENQYGPEFFFFVWFLLAACQGVVVSRDLFTLFVFFEILAISAYILIAYKQKPRAVLAGFRYLLIASVSIAFYLVGVFIIYRGTGALSITTVSGLTERLSRAETALAITTLTVGIVTRMAVFPFHGWLPDAHSIAAHPVSALLSGIVIKAPLVVLFRISTMFPAPTVQLLGRVLFPFGLLSALAGVFLALQQKDAKRLLAYHSISQMGYIVTAFSIYLSESGSLAMAGAFGALFHAVNHALFKSLLFLSVGASCDTAGSRDVYRLRGLGRRAGFWTPLFMVGAFSISGVPLFNGYASKILVSEAVHHNYPAYLLLLLVSAGTAASFFKLGRIFFPAGKAAVTEPGISESPGAGKNLPGLIAAGLTAALCLALGTLPPLFFAPLKSAFTLQPLLKQLGTLAAGFLIYLLALSPAGKHAAHRVRKAAVGTDVLLGLMLAGFLVIWSLVSLGF